MSANLDLVRSIYAAWERGDFSSVEWAHPEIEYVIADGPTPGRWTGRAGLREAFRDVAGAWEELQVEAAKYRDLDDEHVLVLTRLSGRGKRSGMLLEQMRANGADILQFRDREVTKFVLYWDRPHAFSDLGLAE
jgi:ketosteroid isomerase-like protein